MRDCTAVRPRIEVDEKDVDYLKRYCKQYGGKGGRSMALWIGVVTKMGFVIGDLGWSDSDAPFFLGLARSLALRHWGDPTGAPCSETGWQIGGP
jgi:hypothetical protein